MEFYRLVSSQYINQTPMGVKDGPMVLTPRLEAYRAALELYGYPREEWEELTRWALLLHRLVHKLEVVFWPDELGKPRNLVLPEEVLPNGD